MNFSNDKILIFGRGPRAEVFINAFEIDPDSVIGFVESQKTSDTLYRGGTSINSSGRKFSMSMR